MRGDAPSEATGESRYVNTLKVKVHNVNVVSRQNEIARAKNLNDLRNMAPQNKEGVGLRERFSKNVRRNWSSRHEKT